MLRLDYKTILWGTLGNLSLKIVPKWDKVQPQLPVQNYLVFLILV